MNLSFHRAIALASGNARACIRFSRPVQSLRERAGDDPEHPGKRSDDHAEHLEIYQALRARDPVLASQRMQRHLERVREKLVNWYPKSNPVRKANFR